MVVDHFRIRLYCQTSFAPEVSIIVERVVGLHHHHEEMVNLETSDILCHVDARAQRTKTGFQLCPQSSQTSSL